MPIKKKPDSITAFTQHGFKPLRETATGQAVGNCVFCNCQDHFYLNKAELYWDCKKCGESGTVKTFITKLWEKGLTDFKGKFAVNLQADRKIKIGTLRRNGVGYNPATGAYLLPVHRLDNDNLHDLRYYKPGKKGVHSTSGMTVGIFGWERIAKAHHVVICEGEWDCLVVDEIIHELEMKETVAVGVPGANTFKAEWASLFEKKHVTVLYDADEYGKIGMKKVGTILSAVTKKISFIHWPDSSTIGYDIRDLYHDNAKIAKTTWKKISVLLQEECPSSSIVTTVTKSIGRDELTGDGLSSEEAYRQYRKWLYFPEESRMLSAVFGAALANRRDGDPLWLFVVAPPGATKSEVIMSLADGAKIMSTTSLTPAALISGASFAGGGDPSLIPQLDGKVLIVKDFTTILNMPAQNRDAVFGILRDAYDGKIEWQFGNGIRRKYESKFGVIAGVTPAIEQFSEGCAALGERFLQFWVPSMSIKEQRYYLRKARDNEGKEILMRAELMETANAILSKDYTTSPAIPGNISDSILDLAQLTSILRGIVPRDRFTKEVTHHSYHELGTRLTKQLLKFAIGVGQFHGVPELTENEVDVVRIVAYGSVPSGARNTLRIVYNKFQDEPFNLEKIAKILRLPANPTVSRIIQNLVNLDVLKEERLSTLRSQYKMNEDVLHLINQSKFFSVRS